MEYKVLVNILIPEIEEKYEMYLPVNKYIGEICLTLSKIFNEQSKIFPVKNNGVLFNVETGELYDCGLLLRDTNIKNGTELIYI